MIDAMKREFNNKWRPEETAGVHVTSPAQWKELHGLAMDAIKVSGDCVALFECMSHCAMCTL